MLEQWWNELSWLGQVFACMAIPATLILVIQTILLLVGGGLGGGEASAQAGDIDSDGDAHDLADGADGLRVFTVRGLVAFFTIGGWLGLALLQNNISPILSVLFAVLGGLAAMVVVALILKWTLSLQDSGNISLTNAIGKPAQVYLTVPANRSGTGKVTVTVQERLMELDAVTDNAQPLRTGELVTVKALVNSSLLLVG